MDRLEQKCSLVETWVSRSLPPPPFSPRAARKLQGLSQLYQGISGVSCDCHSQNKSELPGRQRDIVTPGWRPLGQKLPHVCLVWSGPATGWKPVGLTTGQELEDPAATTVSSHLLSLSSPSGHGWFLQCQPRGIWSPDKCAPCPIFEAQDWQVKGTLSAQHLSI